MQRAAALLKRIVRDPKESLDCTWIAKLYIYSKRVVSFEMNVPTWPSKPSATAEKSRKPVGTALSFDHAARRPRICTLVDSQPRTKSSPELPA